MLTPLVLTAALLLKVSFVNGASFIDTGDYASYSWGFPYPQSCSCAETGVSLSSCELFKCDCICDVTAGKCDYNCCCDPDCTADQVSRFKDLNSCAAEGTGDTTQYCYSSEHLSKINPREEGQDGFILSGQTSAQAGLHGALCIAKKNVAAKVSLHVSICLVYAHLTIRCVYLERVFRRCWSAAGYGVPHHQRREAEQLRGDYNGPNP
jgi:hypothetical protein